MSSSPSSSSSSSAVADATGPYVGMLDVTCAVDVVLGTGTISVRDCLKMQRLSVIRLQQSAGSDLEVRVHGIGIASGEVVIIDDSTAVRITNITPPPGEDPHA